MEENLKELLAKRFKEIRKSKGMSQRELARLLGTGNGTISNIENGKRNVTIDIIEKIAEALEVSTVELLNFKEYKGSKPVIFNELSDKYPMIPERVLKGFYYLYDQGVRFKELEDYYYLWIIIQALEARK